MDKQELFTRKIERKYLYGYLRRQTKETAH